MLNYTENDRKLVSSRGYVRRKSDGMVLRCPIFISVDEKPEDYEEYSGKRASVL